MSLLEAIDLINEEIADDKCMQMRVNGCVIVAAALLLQGCDKSDRELLSDAQDWVNVQTQKEYRTNKEHCEWQIEQYRLFAGGGRSIGYPCSSYFDRSQRNQFSALKIYHRSGRNSICGTVSGVDLLGNGLQRDFVLYERTLKISSPSSSDSYEGLSPAEANQMREQDQAFREFQQKYCASDK